MPPEDMTPDAVRLAVPARPEYVRLVRLAAAGLATRLEFSYDQVEDLRIAVDELCYLLVGPHGREGNITLTFSPIAASPIAASPTGAALVILGRGRADGGPAKFPELSEQILAALVDEYAVTEDGDGTISFRMVTQRR